MCLFKESISGRVIFIWTAILRHFDPKLTPISKFKNILKSKTCEVQFYKATLTLQVSYKERFIITKTMVKIALKFELQTLIYNENIHERTKTQENQVDYFNY